jgi:NADH:ubiquinone oxidoreductase subunit 3 (subunit A)
MRLGILEIVIILVVVLVIVISVRFARTQQNSARGKSEHPMDTAAGHVERRTKGRRIPLRRIGIALALIGAVMALAGVSMFKWAVQSYVWSFILVAVGLAILLLSTRK